MLFQSEQFALYHPTKIDIKKHPCCILSAVPFPEYVSEEAQEMGHWEIWELIVPLFQENELPVIEIDDAFELYVTAPTIRLFFYTWAYNETTVDLLHEIIQVERQKILENSRLLLMKQEDELESATDSVFRPTETKPSSQSSDSRKTDKT